MDNENTSLALIQLATAARLLQSATATLARAELPPGHAAYFAWLVEQAGQRVTRAEIHAADAVRRTGAHQLDEPSFQAIADAGLAPDAAAIESTRGHYSTGRSFYKEPAKLLGEWLNISRSAATTRLKQADSLIAQVNEAGERLGPRYPQLAEEFQRPETQPRLVLGATAQLSKIEPTLSEAPEPEQARREFEEDAIALIRHEPSTANRHLRGRVQEILGEERSLAALLAEVGLYPCGMRNGLVYYRLVLLPQDAELIESANEQIDHPGTIAGNREELKNLAMQQYLRMQQATPAGVSNDGAIPGEWGEAQSMPDWARAPDPQPAPQDVAESTASSTAPATEEKNSPPQTDLAQTAPEQEKPPAVNGIQAVNSAGRGHQANISCSTGSSPDGMPTELSQPFEELRPEFRHLLGLLSILRSDGVVEGKRPGLVQPQVTVILDYAKMLSLGKNFAVTANGLPISAGAARTMLCNAGILPVVLGGKSEILDIGQENRFFPKYMRRALQAKYRGCAYPGCSMPASRCEVDHIQPWEEGGATSVDNGCLFCPMHHHARHCGLFRVMANDGGPPMVLLPKNLDPEQRPRLNTHWFSPSEAIEIARGANTS